MLWDSAAFEAGMTVGSQIVAVNGRNYDTDLLKDRSRPPLEGPSPPAAGPRGGCLPHRGARLARRPALSEAGENGKGEGTLDALLAPR